LSDEDDADEENTTLDLFDELLLPLVLADLSFFESDEDFVRDSIAFFKPFILINVLLIFSWLGYLIQGLL